MYGMCSPNFYQLFLLAYLYLVSSPDPTHAERVW